MNHKILWLRRRFGWMGNHSGYDQLCEYMSKILPDDTYQSVWQNPGQPRKLLRSMLRRIGKKAKASPKYHLNSTAAEVKVLLKSLQWHPDLIHVTYVEEQLGILPDWKEHLSCKVIGTSHQPAGWWRVFVHEHSQIIANLDALIVVGSREVSYFEKYLPGRVFFIPHGVDTDFFCPLEDSLETKESIRCIFSGKYLRDLDTLAAVIDKVLLQNPHIHFDILLAQNKRKQDDSTLIRMARHEQVHWYEGISDQHLRKLYRNASMLVMPILDSTANNALVEAISCGLPVISNDVGGLRDYTQKNFAELLNLGDVDGFVSAILNLAEDKQEQHKRSKAAREFAETQLDWTNIANKTLKVYDKVTGQ